MTARMFYINSEKYARETAGLLHLNPQTLHIGNYLFQVKGRLSHNEIDLAAAYFPGLMLMRHDRDGFVIRVMPSCIDWNLDFAGKNMGRTLTFLFSELKKYFKKPIDRCWELKQGRCLNFKHHPLIMGILNVTPDSFFDGGRYAGEEKAVAHAREMIVAGVDIIDIGGESSRPGARPVSTEEELERVLPVIRKIRSESSVVISIDTYKSAVARMALDAGSDIINDITGTDFDTGMTDVIKEQRCPVIIMHMQGSPQTMQVKPEYSDVVENVGTYLRKKADEIALLNDGKVILDPGIGFGKTLEHNLKLIGHLRDFTFFGYPLLVGLSRKSFIGQVLNNEPDERLVGGMTAELYCMANGADIVRVHDVKAANDARMMLTAINDV